MAILSESLVIGAIALNFYQMFRTYIMKKANRIKIVCIKNKHSKSSYDEENNDRRRITHGNLIL